MKRGLTILAIASTTIILNSCCFLFFDLYDCDLPLLQSIYHANFSDEAIAALKAAGEAENNKQADQSGGQGSNSGEHSGFSEIIKSPSFVLGPNLSWLGGDKQESEKLTAKPGFQLGAMWSVPVTPGLSVEPGLIYSNRGVGSKTESDTYYEPGSGGSYNYSYGTKERLSYLELPVFAAGHIANGFELYGGPQVAFLLGAKTVSESGGESSTEKGTKGFNKVDFGLSAGARYQIPNTFFKLSLGYYHGLSNLSSGSVYGGVGGYGYSEPKYFTRTVKLGVHYDFPGARTNARSSTGAKHGKGWLRK